MELTWARTRCISGNTPYCALCVQFFISFIVKTSYFFSLIFLCIGTSSPFLLSASAQSGEFRVPAGLRGRDDFWKSVFVDYGENDIIVHHRMYPQSVFSVVDMPITLNKTQLDIFAHSWGNRLWGRFICNN